MALVDGSSEVGKLAITFFNTLFDENATCHIAFGSGFAFAVDESDRAAGLNESAAHTDLMVGGPEVDVDGVEKNGNWVPILRGVPSPVAGKDLGGLGVTAGLELREQALRRHLSIGAVYHSCDLIPVDLHVQEDAEPTTMADIGRTVEPLGSSFHQHFLGAVRSGAPQAQAIVVVVVGRGDEQLPTDKPSGLPVTETLGDPWQREAEASQPIERGGVARSVD